MKFNITSSLNNSIEQADKMIKSLENQKKTTQRLIDSYVEKRQKLIDQLEKLNRQ